MPNIRGLIRVKCPYCFRNKFATDTEMPKHSCYSHSAKKNYFCAAFPPAFLRIWWCVVSNKLLHQILLTLPWLWELLKQWGRRNLSMISRKSSFTHPETISTFLYCSKFNGVMFLVPTSEFYSPINFQICLLVICFFFFFC